MKPGTNVDDLLTPANQVERGCVDEELAKNPSIFNVVSPLTALEFASRVQSGQNLTEQMFVSAVSEGSERTLAGGPRGLCRRRGAPVECHCAFAKGSVPPGVDPLRPARTQWFASRGGQGLRPRRAARPHGGLLEAEPQLQPGTQRGGICREDHGLGPLPETRPTITTGVPEIEKDVNDYVRSALRTLILLAAVLMALILIVAFRVRWRLLPFAVLGVGMIWAFGGGGLFRHPTHICHPHRHPRPHGCGHGLLHPDARGIEEEVRVNRAGHRSRRRPEVLVRHCSS